MSASARPRRWQGIDWALVLAIALLPLGWGSLLRIGGYSLEPFHLAMLILIGAALLKPSGLADAVNVIRIYWPFFTGVALYLLLHLLSFTRTGSVAGLDFYVIKQFAFVLFALAAAVRVMSCRSLAPTLYIGGGLALAFFLVYLQISANIAGRSALDALITLASTGNYHGWTWGFLMKVFNAYSAKTAGGAEAFVTALKNNIGSGLLVSFLCFRAGAAARRPGLAALVLDRLVSAGFVLAILMMLSRSVLLALALAVLTVLLIDACVRNGGKMVLLLIAAAAAALVLLPALPEGLIDGLAGRFFEDTGSFTARLDVFALAIPEIESHFWLGRGIGSQGEGDASIHNLFLSAWYNAGIAAFLAAALFWTAAVALILRQLLKIAGGGFAPLPRLALFHAWIAVLPLPGLLRCWLIGGGVLNFAAWFSLGILFGVLYRAARAPVAAAPGGTGRLPAPAKAAAAG